jgi:hypothetical protein
VSQNKEGGMKVERRIIVMLNEKEADVLKTVLGSLTDPQFKQFCGVEGIDRELMRDLYDQIPELEEG